MLVERELFVIPDGERFILYAPTRRLAVAVSGGVVRELQACEMSGEYPEGPVREFLLDAGILVERAAVACRPVTGPSSFLPTSVTLFTTSDCGLRCIYCYASAGEAPKVMDVTVAKAAIDLIIANAITVKKQSVEISFHGGGEPLYGASGSLVREIVAYAKNAAAAGELRAKFSCATNGVLSGAQVAWAVENVDRLNLSVDGPPDIQDGQRPLKTGARSSPFVQRTLALLEEHHANYGIRVTVTRMSVGRLVEIVEYIHRTAPSASIHLEPLFSCGRCATTGAEAPDSDIFAEAFLEARAYARGLGVDLYYSGASLERCDEYFCGALRGNFCVTPWGDVTSCYEVSLPTDERAPIFFFGAYDRSLKAFRFDEERLGYLAERCVSTIPACNDCLLKYACAGDCPAKAVTMTGSLFGGFRCDANRVIGESAIVEHIQPSMANAIVGG